MARDPLRTTMLRKAREAKRAEAGLMTMAEVAAALGIANQWRARTFLEQFPGCPPEIPGPTGRGRYIERAAFEPWWANITARAEAQVGAKADAQRAA